MRAGTGLITCTRKSRPVTEPDCDRRLFGINSVYCAECTAWDGSVERYYFRTGSGEMYRYVIPYLDVKEE